MKCVVIVIVFLVVCSIISGILSVADANGLPTVEIYCGGTVTITYGDSLVTKLRHDSDFVVKTFSKVYKREREVEIDSEMLSYDPEKIGTQTATISYEGESNDFQLTINPKQLEIPNVSTYDGVVTWYKTGSKYEVKVNGKIYQTEEERFDLKELDLQTVTNVCVRSVAKDERYLSSNYSSNIQISKLSPVTDITYNNGYFTWDSLYNAVTYKVVINDDEFETTERKFPAQNLKLANNISITIKGAATTITSSASEKSFTKLPNPQNVSFTSYSLSWQYPDNNCQFLVTINNKELKTYNKRISFDFVNGVTYKIKFTALSYAENIIASDTSEYDITTYSNRVASPIVTVAMYNYKNEYLVTVGSVEHADIYLVTIEFRKSGEETLKREYQLTQNNMQVDFTLPQGYAYTVVVIAKDSSGNYMDSYARTIN